MQFMPYLTFDGNAAEAMKFYAEALGGKLERMMTFGEMPASNDGATEGGASASEGCVDVQQGPMPEAVKNRILHAAIQLDDGMLMASDTWPGQPYEGIKGVGIAIGYESIDRAKQVFERLAEGGKVTMQPGETFWVDWFASVEDRFGTAWLINGGKSRI